MHRRVPLLALALLWVPLVATAQIDARLLQQPDVSETQITFVYGNDVWVVDKEGGPTSASRTRRRPWRGARTRSCGAPSRR